MTTTRFTHGVTNSTPTENLGDMGQLNPTKWQTAFNDFMGLNPTWGETGISGAGGLATSATTVAVDTPTTCYVLNDQKEHYVKAKLSLAAIASTVLTVGFADVIGTPTAGIYLTLTDGVTVALNVNGATTVTTSVAVAPGAATQFTLGWRYMPNKGFKVFLNDDVVLSSTDITTFDEATACVFGGVVTGTTATWDYMFAAQER